MNKKVLKHYLEFGPFTNPGCYKGFLSKLPTDVRKLGELVTHQIVHRVTLKEGNTNANHDKRYGDMNKFPWHRLRCEDDIFTTVISTIGELLRLDKKGFFKNRKMEDKVILTCRNVAILMAAILKVKGIPCRVRSGFGLYFKEHSGDHWINQYWSKKEKRWITFDSDGFFDDVLDFDQYNIPDGKFGWAADSWLGLRSGKLKSKEITSASGFKGRGPALWAIFQDFHCLMNNEILYTQSPSYIYGKFHKLTEKDFKEIDRLAKLMLDPDKNFDALVRIWNNKKKFRILNGPLIGDGDHVKYK